MGDYTEAAAGHAEAETVLSGYPVGPSCASPLATIVNIRRAKLAGQGISDVGSLNYFP